MLNKDGIEKYLKRWCVSYFAFAMWRCPTFLQIAQWRRCRLNDAGVVLRWRNIEIDLPRGNPPTKPNLPSPTDVKTVVNRETLPSQPWN